MRVRQRSVCAGEAFPSACDHTPASVRPAARLTAARKKHSFERHAYGSKKPILLVRTDFRSAAGNAGDYNLMLTQSATVRLDLRAASTTEVVSAILEAMGGVEAGIGSC